MIVFLQLMQIMKKLYLTIIHSTLACLAMAQTEISMPKIPQMRQLFHENIDNNQKAIIHLNSSADSIFTATGNIDIDLQLTQILKVHINNLQAFVEQDSALSESQKYIWLRGINDLLVSFIDSYKQRNIKGILLGDVIISFEEAMQAEIKHHSIASIIDKNELEVASILTENFALQKNIGIQDCRNLLILKMCNRNPENILNILTRYPDMPFADSLIAITALKHPEDVYDYAAAPNALGKKIAASANPLTKLISQMATSDNGRIFFPFLDNLFHHTITFDSITNALQQPDGYYKLLVATEIDYAGRLEKKDTPLVMNVLKEKLRSVAIDNYINEINALHDEKIDAVRFKKSDNLTPQEIYYLCVLAEEEIYTSSYLGLYNRMFLKMPIQRSDTLLQWVHNDFYKKFIKMAAAYNVLDDFLNKMDTANSEKLIKNFVNNLDKNNSLEDAVDVADSYASINNETIKKNILLQVKYNLQQSNKYNNYRGEIIYGLLDQIFENINTNTTAVNSILPNEMPPIYTMPISALKDSSGRIIVQQFFYGDKDGNTVFNSFLNSFNNANWKITKKPEWVEVRSRYGTPIVIYSNKPLDETKDLDALAQEDLAYYLDSIGVNPTITIHRGHSYYVKSTIKQLPPSSKIILLGSCGGYHSLNDVLTICPSAHIIASKQVGTGIVNITLIESMMETLRMGKNLNWPLFWKNMQTKFKGDYKEKFDDYIPPHKNLGAIFIMAYNNAMIK